MYLLNTTFAKQQSSLCICHQYKLLYIINITEGVCYLFYILLTTSVFTNQPTMDDHTRTGGHSTQKVTK